MLLGLAASKPVPGAEPGPGPDMWLTGPKAWRAALALALAPCGPPVKGYPCTTLLNMELRLMGASAPPAERGNRLPWERECACVCACVCSGDCSRGLGCAALNDLGLGLRGAPGLLVPLPPVVGLS